MGGFKAFLAGVALACVGFSPIAHADAVLFYTTGVFSGTDATAGGASLKRTITAVSGATETQELTFSGIPSFSPTFIPDDYNGNLGVSGIFAGSLNLNFSYSRASGSTALDLIPFALNDKFTLTIWQVSPGNTSGSAIGTVTSTVQQTGGQDAVVNFTPNPLQILNEYYSLPNPVSVTHALVSTGLPNSLLVGSQTSSAPLNIDIYGPALGNGNVAPLPQTATLGLGMFASLGLVFGLKRKFNAELAA